MQTVGLGSVQIVLAHSLMELSKMRLIARQIVLVGCLASCMVCSATELTSTKLEKVIMNKSGSRIPAPTVSPISLNGVRYEQVPNGLLAGFNQMGGYLAAYDESTGQLLWTTKVYDNLRNSEKEGDVQDIFFKSMVLQADGTLLIENERSKKFIVNPVAKTSIPIM
jgi:outer membrane protein assembly factor BamB